MHITSHHTSGNPLSSSHVHYFTSYLRKSTLIISCTLLHIIPQEIPSHHLMHITSHHTSGNPVTSSHAYYFTSYLRKSPHIIWYTLLHIKSQDIPSHHLMHITLHHTSRNPFTSSHARYLTSNLMKSSHIISCTLPHIIYFRKFHLDSRLSTPNHSHIPFMRRGFVNFTSMRPTALQIHDTLVPCLHYFVFYLFSEPVALHQLIVTMPARWLLTTWLNTTDPEPELLDLSAYPEPETTSDTITMDTDTPDMEDTDTITEITTDIKTCYQIFEQFLY